MIEKFAGVRVLVVGDLMLDRYLSGSVERISPEAPVPILRVRSRHSVAGGAANVAANVKGLGAKVTLVGAVGDDEAGEELLRALDANGTGSGEAVCFRNRPTTVKTRLVANHQQVARFDSEEDSPLSEEDEEVILERASVLAENADVAILSDYAKGVVGERLSMRLITKMRSIGKPILVDPKGKAYGKYKGATLITPNEREAIEASSNGTGRPLSLEEIGSLLVGNLELEGLLITQGDKGMTLFRNDRPPEHLPAHERNVYDVTGAGDTVIATLAVAIGAGADLLESSRLANLAAGAVVERLGTSAVTAGDLRKELEG